MGLSDEERHHYMFNAAHRVFRAANAALNDIKSRSGLYISDELMELFTYAKGVYRLFHKSSGKSSYWLFGGDLDAEHVNYGNMIGAAIYDSVAYALGKEQEFRLRSAGCDDPLYERVYSLIHRERGMSIVRCSGEHGFYLRKVIEIVSNCETFFYAYNRYQNDAVCEAWEDKAQFFSELQMRCAALIRHEKPIAITWMLWRLSEMAYTNFGFKGVNKNDRIDPAMKLALHFNYLEPAALNDTPEELRRLGAAIDKYSKIEKLTSQHRFELLTILLLPHVGQWPHRRKEFLQKATELKFDVAPVLADLDRAGVWFAEKDKESKERGRRYVDERVCMVRDYLLDGLSQSEPTARPPEKKVKKGKK